MIQSNTPGLAPLTNLLSEGFPIKSSDRDTPKNVSNRLRIQFHVGTGILSNRMKSPSSECYIAFWRMTICNDILHRSDITPIYDPVTKLDLIPEFDGVS